jgi:chromosome partitioning protein
MRVIAVCNQKGGVGKTTVALLLADAAARAGERVLLVDLDPQANATGAALAGFDHTLGSIADVLVGPAGGDIRPIIRRSSWGLDVAPSNVALASKDRNRRTADEHDLRRLLAAVDDAYDFAVIDSPPSIGVLTVNALTAAHEYLVVTDPSRFALDGIGGACETADIVRTYFNPTLDLAGIAVNLVDHTLETARRIDELYDVFAGDVLDAAIPRRVIVKETLARGESLWSVGNARGVPEICDAAERLYAEAVTRRVN